MELLIGAGSNHTRQFHVDDRKEWSRLLTLDIEPGHKPDVVWDLNQVPLPFGANLFDEVHAYEVLEHIGRQGEFWTFFALFADLWRILKPGGVLCGTSPAASSPWAWGDPGHTRIINREALTFLVQPEYTRQVGRSPMTDYRSIYRADFDLEMAEEKGGKFLYALRAVKPSRIGMTPRTVWSPPDGDSDGV